MDDLGLVEAVDPLGEGIAVAVTRASGGGLDASLGPAPSAADADIERAWIGMVRQIAAMGRPSFVQRLLESMENEPGMSGPVSPPARDAAGKGGDHEGGIDEARPGLALDAAREDQNLRYGYFPIAIFQHAAR